MKVKKRTLLLVAGGVWAFAGGNVLRIGVLAYAGGAAGWLLLLSLGVFALFQRLVFAPMVKKHTARILGYGQERLFFLRFFDRRSFCIMGGMIALGVGLRASGLCPQTVIAVLYTGLGASLLLAGVLFLVQYLRQPSAPPEQGAAG